MAMPDALYNAPMCESHFENANDGADDFRDEGFQAAFPLFLFFKAWRTCIAIDVRLKQERPLYACFDNWLAVVEDKPARPEPEPEEAIAEPVPQCYDEARVASLVAKLQAVPTTTCEHTSPLEITRGQ